MSLNTWQPSASINSLKKRARILQNIRNFFTKRSILEVETPLLSQYTVTDVHLESFSTLYQDGDHQQTYYLQTSPEYAMKRLLAADIGPIFQLSKAFRNQGESGRQHNPEFTLLEWYQPHYDHYQLMDEVDKFLQDILNSKPATRITYQDLFLQTLNIDPFSTSIKNLKDKIIEKEISMDLTTINNKDTLLHILLTHVIEPQIGLTAPLFLYNFPASQAALAKINDCQPAVAERFEVYFKGLELANGFHELTNANEQQTRFVNDQKLRKRNQQIIPDIDKRFINALHHGLPQCAGVALGVDRLIMLALNKKDIREVISFSWQNS